MLTNSKFEPFLEEVFSKYQINTPLRKAHFLAQLKHESGNFTRVQESFNYKTNQRLFDIFPKYFDKDKNGKMSLIEAQTINSYIGKPEKLANFLYANRMGNGNEASGDGWKHRGKGLIQLTGKGTQTEYAKYVGVDINESPDFLTEAKYAIDSAGWFWMKRGLNKLADDTTVTVMKDGIRVGPVTRITKAVNGGKNGLEDRIINFNYYKKLLGVK